MISNESVREWLDTLNNASMANTTCCKTYVGAAIGVESLDGGTFIPDAIGVNHNDDYNCKEQGCYRRIRFGSDSKEFRAFCKAKHAEIDAIEHLHRCTHYSGPGWANIAIVTRYPCEACARALVAEGIQTVYYGRRFEISEETKRIFSEAGVSVYWIKDWEGDPNDCDR